MNAQFKQKTFFILPRALALLTLALAILPSLAAADLPLQTSVTKDGITWTFDHAVPVGQFVNGDIYVVGTVTVTAITPAPQTSSPYMNGSVLNLPASNGKSGFDQRLNDGVDESWWFDASLRKALSRDGITRSPRPRTARMSSSQ